MKSNSISEFNESKAKENITADNMKKAKLSKVEGARRILYKGEERYIITCKNAKNVFPDAFELEGYPDDSLVIIMRGEGLKDGVCASSDDLNEPYFTIEAIFPKNDELSYEQEVRKPYCIPSIIIAIATMVINDSGIMENDINIYFKNLQITEANFIMVSRIVSASHGYLLKNVILKILETGISDYAEAKDDYYYETRFFSKWGEGEEGTGVLNENQKPTEPIPVAVNIIQNDYDIISEALSYPFMLEIPYIKLISENGIIPV